MHARTARRKPYMMGGVALCAFAWVTLGALDPTPSLGVIMMLLFTGTLGLVWCDTMVDTLVVERVRHEVGDKVGTMQTTCWVLRYSGMLAGILLGGWLLEYAHLSPHDIFIIQGALHGIVLFPFILPLGTPVLRRIALHCLARPLARSLACLLARCCLLVLLRLLSWFISSPAAARMSRLID